MSSKSIPVTERTYHRLLAYRNRNLLEKQSFDASLNELMDCVEFPPNDVIEADYDTIWNAVPRFKRPSPREIDSAPDRPGTCITSDNRKSIPASEHTRSRLQAYCDRTLPKSQSYNQAVNELLDWIEFPTAEEIYRDYRVVWDLVPRSGDAERRPDGFCPSVRAEPVVTRVTERRSATE